ncbi:MAG: carboxypeptidase regulatory-like domain-containing protein, partial [Dehalococcoidia bacterium]|nr:carboxypeptidase regulatory-like domain-containing protein [Dehalococcoidia bacterium]
QLMDGLPQTARGQVIDAYSGRPIVGAVVQVGATSATTSTDGSFVIGRPSRAHPLTIAAPGYASLTTSRLEEPIALRPTFLVGAVVEAATGQPIRGATVSVGDLAVRTNHDGLYRLTDVDANPTVIVKAPGYAKVEYRPSQTARLDARLVRQPIRAVYMSAATLGHPTERERLLAQLSPTGFNAVVIDLKSERGRLSHQSAIPLALQSGASNDTAPDLGAIVRRLDQTNIYTIARIVAYKDRAVGVARPDLAIKDKRSGRVFTDPDGSPWLDPFRSEVTDYLVALAEEAARLGFDEVQFDYLRFPIDDRVDALQFAMDPTPESRQAAIVAALSRVTERLRPHGVFVSVTMFGYALWNPGEQGYGQELERIASVVDYVSPTLYPSTFGIGVPGLGNDRALAVNAPYDVVRRSLDEAKRRLRSDGLQLRPWLQYFDDPTRVYGAPEINDQLRAAIDANASGWMLWDPTNQYQRGEQRHLPESTRPIDPR